MISSTAAGAIERGYYSNVDLTRWDRPSGFPLDTSLTNPNNKVAKVTGSGNKIGPGILLKVMAGDQFHVQAKAGGMAVFPARPPVPCHPLFLH